MTNESLIPPSSSDQGKGHLSASALKIIACIFMTVDHVGVHILPQVEFLRILGRIAFPIFAYFIAEGCRYTRNKPKRLLIVSLLGILFEAAYFLYDGYTKGDLLAGGFEGNIFLTFALSILLIYCLQAVKKSLAARSAPRVLLFCAAFVLALFFAREVHKLVDGISYMAGLNALENYRTAPAGNHGVERPMPLHDNASHASDAFRYFCEAYDAGLVDRNLLQRAVREERGWQVGVARGVPWRR